jgi:hypothetical protein
MQMANRGCMFLLKYMQGKKRTKVYQHLSPNAQTISQNTLTKSVFKADAFLLFKNIN